MEHFCVPKTFWYRKKLWIGGGWSITFFRKKFFCLAVLKNFVGEPFKVSGNFGYRKVLCKRRGYHYYPSKSFCLAVLKNFVGEPFNVSGNFGYRKVLCKRRGYHYYLSKSFCLALPKNFVGEPFWVSKKIRIEKCHA